MSTDKNFNKHKGFKIINLNIKSLKYLDYLVLNIAMILILIFVLDLNSLVFKYPIDYSGDSLQVLMFMKMIINGDLPFYTYATSYNIGLPFGFVSADYPSPMSTNFLFVKMLSLFSSDPIIVFNAYILVSYFMIINVIFFVLRRLKVNHYLAISISLLYALVPFHHFRIGHTWYVNYFLLPIVLYYILLLWRSKPLFFIKKYNQYKYKFDLSSRNLIMISVLVLFSLWNFYFTFFFVLLASAATISTYYYRRNRYHLYSGLMMIFFVTAPFVINLIPFQLYQHEHGKNLQVANRKSFEAEVYGLRIAQMLLPVDGHNNALMAKAKKKYNMAPLINENSFATLGFIGTLGFLLMTLYILFNDKILSTIKKLSILNFTAVIIATMGGYSSLFALLITPQIRGYNRISIFISTMALIVFALAISHLMKTYSLKSITKFIIALIILFIGTYDQVPAYMSYHKAIRLRGHLYEADKNFIQDIEKDLSSSTNNMVFQLPHMSAPESEIIHQLGEYKQAVGFLFSDTIKWSYGGIKGRESDQWIKNLFKLPLKEQVKILLSSGFNGIYIDRRGYKDDAKELEENLSKILGTKPIISGYKTKSFFKMKPTGHKTYQFD